MGLLVGIGEDGVRIKAFGEMVKVSVRGWRMHDAFGSPHKVRSISKYK